MGDRKREDDAATDAMRALDKARQEDALPADLIDDLQEAVASIYTEIVLDRASTTPQGQGDKQ